MWRMSEYPTVVFLTLVAALVVVAVLVVPPLTAAVEQGGEEEIDDRHGLVSHQSHGSNALCSLLPRLAHQGL